MDVQQSTQPVDQFIVKVKLLTNEVFEFVIKPEQTKVSQLKQMILEKINIPLERQRIVFGGKQLVDDNKVSEYVKQSGMTVHLIAKMGGQQTTSANTTSTTQPSNQQQSSTQNQNGQNSSSQAPPPPPPPLPNPFGNLLRGIGLGNPQATTMTFSNMGDLNQGLGGILGSLGIRLPPQPPQQNNQQTTQQRTQTNTSNNPFQTPPSNRPSQQQTQPTSSFTSNIPQQPSQQTQANQPFNVSNEPILRLNQTISTLNLPSEPVLDNRHLSLREQTAQYLRRLQHQYMRMIPQLNRSIQLLNQGRVSHLGQVLKLFEAIDEANEHAELAIERLLNLPVNQQHTQPQQTTSAQQPNTSNQPTFQSNQPVMEVETVQIGVENNGSQEQPVNANIQATIIIQEDDIDLDDEGSTINQAARNQQTQQNPRVVNSATFSLGNDLGGLAGLLGSLTGQPPAQSQSNTQPPMMGGLNLGGLMSMFGGLGAMNPQQNRPQQPSQQQTQQTTQSQQPTQPQQIPHVHGPQCNHHHQPPQQQPSQQQPQQMPFDIGNLASMASMIFQQPPQQQSQQSSQQPPNPFGGFNLGSIFSQIQESGGVGEIMSMSLGQTIEEGTGAPTIYSAILRSFTGSDILSCFTSKNFDFFDTKYDNVRENFLHAISIAGSQQDLVQSISQDFANLIVPTGQVFDQEKTVTQTTDIIRKHVAQIARFTMNKGDSKYSEVVLQHLKRAFCESIHHVINAVNPSTLTSGQSATNLVFNNLKARSIELMDDFIQGLSGMFYGFIERDFIRIYNEFLAEEKRKQQRTAEQIQNEEQLLKRIQTQSKKDVEYLKNFKHSQFYNPKSE